MKGSRDTPVLFWLALAGCCLGPLAYAAFVLFLSIRH